MLMKLLWRDIYKFGTRFQDPIVVQTDSSDQISRLCARVNIRRSKI